MTELGDRVLGFIIIATGLAGLFGWVIGTYGEYEGSLRYVATAGILVSKRITATSISDRDVASPFQSARGVICVAGRNLAVGSSAGTWRLVRRQEPGGWFAGRNSVARLTGRNAAVVRSASAVASTRRQSI